MTTIFFKKVLPVIMVLLALACNSNKKTQKLHIKLLETSDVHGVIFPYNFIYNKPTRASLSQVTTFVNQERAKKNQEVLLLDNGDILQGQPTVYYYNFERPEQTHLLAEVMNFMKYDAASIGNHDIEAGHAVYDKIRQEYQFDWLAANAVNEKTEKPYFTPYKVFDIQGVKVVVLGLITPAIHKWLPPKIWSGIRFDDMIESAQKWVKIIQEKEKPDVLVGLFHAGIDYTYSKETAKTPKNENASLLVAQEVQGFDVIFAGHDHQAYNQVITNNFGEKVLLLDPAAHAQKVAVADIELNWNQETATYDKKIQGELVAMKKFEADSSFNQRFSAAYDTINAYVTKPIGTFEQNVGTRESMFGDGAFTDLIHQLQLQISGADVSFTALLAYDATIKKGQVTVSDMFKLYKFENLLYTMELSGLEIKNYLEYSSSLWFNQMKNSDDHLLLFKKDENGKLIHSNFRDSYELKNAFFNFSSAAGLNYEIDVSKPSGERIKISGFTNGNQFDLQKKYKVAINSYRGNGGGEHLTKGAKISTAELQKRIIKSTEKDLRYYLIKWIEKNQHIKIQKDNNWKVVPEQWWKKGKEKDYKLLYGKK